MPGTSPWLSIRTSRAQQKQQPRPCRIYRAPRVAAAPRILTRPQLRHGLFAPGNCSPGPPGTRMGEGRQGPASLGGLWGPPREGATRLSGSPQGATAQEGMPRGIRGLPRKTQGLRDSGSRRRSPLGNSGMEMILGCSRGRHQGLRDC